MWQLAHITTQAGARDFFWPLIWRGLGLGLVFVPFTTMTLADVDVTELAQATGILNFFRQLGGSFGFALMATLLDQYTAVKWSMLSAHVSMYDFATRMRVGQLTSGLAGRGLDPWAAHSGALKVVERQLMGQASVLAFARVYVISGLVLLAAMPLLVLIRKTQPAARVGVLAE